MTASERSSWRRFPANVGLATATIRRAAPREYRALLLASAVSSLSLVALMLSGRELLTRLTTAESPLSLGQLAPLLIVLGVASGAGAAAVAVQAERRWLLGYLVEHEATRGIVKAAAGVSLAEFESPDFQDHLQRSLRQAVHRPWEVAQALSQLMAATFGTVAVGLVLLTVQPLLVPALLLAGIPAAWAATRNSQALYDAMHAITPLNREREYLQDVLTARDEAKEVRAFGSSSYLRKRYDDRYRREIEALRAVTRIRAKRSLFAGLGSTIIMLGVLTGLLALTVRGSVSLADAAIGAVAVQQLAVRVRGANTAVGAIQESSLFLEDYGSFLNRVESVSRLEPRPPSGDRLPDPGPVVVEDVWFTYPGAASPALRGVSMTIKPGQVVALVGANGSGKSTLAKLLCNLYEPDRGTITWREPPESSAEQYAPRVSAIFQDFTRYAMSGHDNIAIGDVDYFDDEPRVASAARAGKASEFLETLPDGYRTWLSPSFDGGTDLSVGQWQRVAMARALFRDAPLLVLDEPTAALDPSAERELINSTARAFTERAVLVISHRFANVVDADLIYVLDQGTILEHGTHAQLLARDGRYAELFRLQAAPFQGVRP